MSPSRVLTVLLGTVMMCASLAPSHSFARSDPGLTMTSYGAARVGMSLRQLEVALGRELVDLYEPIDNCRIVGSADARRKVSFMMIDGKMVRIEAEFAGVTTPSGIRIGVTRDEVLSTYGNRLEETPHAYSDGTYLTLYSADRRYGIRFEIYEGKVVGMHAGTGQAVQLVEGCA